MSPMQGFMRFLQTPFLVVVQTACSSLTPDLTPSQQKFALVPSMRVDRYEPIAKDSLAAAISNTDHLW